MTAGSTAPNLMDRVRGALLGLAVGDALGGPLEFLPAAEIRAGYGRPVDEYVGGGWQSGPATIQPAAD